MNVTRYKATLWLSQHWLLVFNIFFFTYAALPILAPILLAYGYINIASIIYRAYGYTCHQLPSHSFFIAGQQIAICQRCTAIYSVMALTGLAYTAIHFLRLPPLSFQWFLLFLIPMGVDGGMAFVSELTVVLPFWPLWVIGLMLIVLIGWFMRSQRAAMWQVYLFLAAGPLSLLYVQWFGPHQSSWLLRVITGSIYGVGSIWLIYPMLEDSFRDLRDQTQRRLAQMHV